MSKEWPLEGHFACGGQGLLVTPDCSLGREFTSRTANHDLIIGLPQLQTVEQLPRDCFRPNGLTAPETRTRARTRTSTPASLGLELGLLRGGVPFKRVY